MKFKKENWQPTIGDKFILVNFGGVTFVWLKHKSDNNNNIHFEEVTPTISSLQSGQFPRLTAGYLGIQASSKYIIEQYRKSRDGDK